jgi:hypothetical protein
VSIDPAIYKFYEAGEQTGWTGDPVTLVNALNKLNYGLRPETNSVCCFHAWALQADSRIGKELIPPASKNEYQVPDMYAVFDPAAGPVPIPIEVKCKQKLGSRPGYYPTACDTLRSYQFEGRDRSCLIGMTRGSRPPSGYGRSNSTPG